MHVVEYIQLQDWVTSMRHCLMFRGGCAVGLIDLKGAKKTNL